MPPEPPAAEPDGRRLLAAVDATALIGQPTGVGVFCREVLSAMGRRTDVDARGFAVSWRQRGAMVDVLPKGVPAVGRPMPARPLHQLWGRLPYPPIEWFVGRVDVVHGTNFVVPPTARAARVVTVHDLTTVRYPQLCTPDTLRFPHLIRRALAQGAYVHTPSAFVAAEVVDVLGADPDRVRAIHSGVPSLPDPPPDAAGPDHLPVVLPEPCTRYVLSVSTAEPRKDLPGLVRAFSALAPDHRDVALVLAGPPGWGTEGLDRALGDSPVADRILRTGWLDDAKLARLLRAAAVLAYPSRYEGFGFPPLQAMAAGVPVVATSAGALPEVLGDAALLSPVGDTAELAHGLIQVLDDPDLAAQLVARGRARAAGFTWDRCAALLVDLYRQALAAR